MGAGLVACTPQSSARDAGANSASTPPTHEQVASRERAPANPSASSPNTELATPSTTATPAPSTSVNGAPHPTASLPLRTVADTPLPGKATRFDYQAVDAARGRLIIAHMNDASVVVVALRDGSIVKVIPNVPVPRGVAVGNEAKRIFVTSSPHTLVVLDADSLAEIAHVPTGAAPDGVAWDGTHRIVAVSDQADGAISLIAEAGSGKRSDVRLGRETGNVVFDARRGYFWIAVEKASPPDELVAVDPTTAKPVRALPLPGCSGAHGVMLDPQADTAFVACEDNTRVARVALEANDSPPPVLAKTGADPDVLALDPALGWLYVAAESGDLTVFDASRPGLNPIGREHPADGSHTVAVDPTTHRVYFPLAHGPNGRPTLRIMLPTGLGS